MPIPGGVERFTPHVRGVQDNRTHTAQ